MIILFFVSMCSSFVTSTEVKTAMESTCGGPLLNIKPISMVTPKYMGLMPMKLTPYKMKLLFHSGVIPESRNIIEKAAQLGNDRLAPMMQGPTFGSGDGWQQPNLPKLWDAKKEKCFLNIPPEIMDFPPEFIGPCFKNGAEIQNATMTMTEEIRNLKLHEFNVLIFAFVNDEGIVMPICNEYPDVLAAAMPLLIDEISRRPTHGLMFFCKKPASRHMDELKNTLLHEAMHVITGGSMVPYAKKEYKCSSNDIFTCQGRTWKTINRPWKDQHGPVYQKDVYLVITPNVKKAAQDHFQCPELEGAELNSLRTNRDNQADFANTFGHWSMRLFPDELMAPAMTADQRLSTLTLSALKDTGWYEVDLTKAEPLVVSRPRDNGCELASGNCHNIMAQRISVTKSSAAGPYCNDKTNLCSRDGSSRLYCMETNKRTSVFDSCRVRIAQPQNVAIDAGYDVGTCKNAQKQPSYAMQIGGQIGADSICTTFTNVFGLKDNEYKTYCVNRYCDHAKQSILLTLNPQGAACSFECNKTEVDKEKTFSTGGQCNQRLGSSVSLICPSYQGVCLGAHDDPSPPDPHSGTDAPMLGGGIILFAVIAYMAILFDEINFG